MKVSHRWLQSYFEKPIPEPSALAELFTFHSFEIEGIESWKSADGKSTDTVIDAKILPDRAHYCLSHTGIAQEVSFITGQVMKTDGIPASPTANIETEPSVTIEDSNFCRRYIARYVENVKVADSPDWMRNYLEAIGARSINSIVDGTNLNMFNNGQPLHAFDVEKVVGDIVVRAAKSGEKIRLLDSKDAAGNPTPGAEIALLATDYVIADNEGPLAIAGVKGGGRAGVTATTQRIIIEAANFNPTIVRRTATRLGIRNESSKRFENEISPELALEGMDNMCALVKEMCPDAKFGPVVDIYPKKAVQTVIGFNPTIISERLGIEVPIAQTRAILERMGISIREEEREEAGDENWKLTIPFGRFDLTVAQDIAEEVGRIYGYDKIVGKLPPKTVKSVVNSEYYVLEKIKNILVDAGLSEVMLYTLVAKGDIEVAYPLASDKSHLRTSLTPLMLQSVTVNARNADLLGLDAVKQFEIGHVFIQGNGAPGTSESRESISLAIGASQVKKIKGVKSESIVIDAFALVSNIFGVKIKPSLRTEGTAVVGEAVLDIEALAAMPEIYSALSFSPVSTVAYQPFSIYPFIVRDIALFAPDTTTEVQVWNEIAQGIVEAGGEASELLVRHALFDVFKKDGKTSYAFRMVFQSKTATLTNDDVNAIMEKVYTRVKGAGWEVR